MSHNEKLLAVLQNAEKVAHKAGSTFNGLSGSATFTILAVAVVLGVMIAAALYARTGR